MAEIVPSYVRKISRASVHLVDLKVAIDRWAGRHPYAVERTAYKTRTAYRLRFTEDPINTDIGIIAADLVYNLRSGLDHLAAALVPPKDRDSVYFPIFWAGVWEAEVPGDSEQRSKDRGRWTTITRNMKAAAVAHLKQLQQPDGGYGDAKVHSLLMLNRLSNTDRHSQLPIFPTALRAPAVAWADRLGRQHVGADTRTRNPLAVVENGAELLGIPKEAKSVDIKGAPLVAIRIASPDGKGNSTFELPDSLERAVVLVREIVISPLIPHLYVPTR